MRADRLLTLLLLLQSRGRMTARALAAELGVSERTVYRDLDALGAAGVPVYAERGPGGGCALLDSYRTSLTGLTNAETRALFALSLPTPLADLGLGQDARTALLKLTVALPTAQQGQEAWLRQRLYLDWSAGGDEERVPFLPSLQRAVWADRRVRLTYRLENAPYRPTFSRVVDPYGLVGQAGVWYVVWGIEGRVQVYRVARLLGVEMLDETFVRPAGFDLATFWVAWRAETAQAAPRYPVQARMAPDLAASLPLYFGERIREEIARGETSADGWLTVTLPFDSLEAARARLLGFGGAVEVIAPRPLRLSVADFARQAAARYEEQQPVPGRTSAPDM